MMPMPLDLTATHLRTDVIHVMHLHEIAVHPDIDLTDIRSLQISAIMMRMAVSVTIYCSVVRPVPCQERKVVNHNLVLPVLEFMIEFQIITFPHNTHQLLL